MLAQNSKRAILRVAGSVAAIKGYSFVMLLVFAVTARMKSGGTEFVAQVPGQARSERLHQLRVDFFERLAPFDGQFYLDIAARGYRRFGERELVEGHGPPGNYAFFPLLPALLRILSWLPWSPTKSMVLVNLTVSVAAYVVIWRIAKDLNAPAPLTLALMLSFPTAIFQSVLYTEGLFLLLSAAVYRSVSGDRSQAAAGFALVAGLCRPQGVLVSALAVPKFFRDRSHGKRARCLWPVLTPLLALAIFAFVLWASIGDPFAFLKVQASWGREYGSLSWVDTFLRRSKYPDPPVDLFGLIFGVGLLPWMWRRLPVELSLYGTGTVVLPLLTGSILSMGRFLSVSFPHFICLALLLQSRRRTAAILVLIFVIGQNLLARGLITWHFVG